MFLYILWIQLIQVENNNALTVMSFKTLLLLYCDMLFLNQFVSIDETCVGINFFVLCFTVYKSLLFPMTNMKHMSEKKSVVKQLKSFC